ncbi:hypothetical protein GRAN_1735 [Granulicella sibirica]|uniref:Uncharacterized protein n=1 Tax=Granulicella sibirica TaxID=2479048 RepID=A0A4Q0T3X7_9BACT|nr:hypothetical protein GRAN_1735 [Granulicella sibirica]
MIPNPTVELAKSEIERLASEIEGEVARLKTIVQMAESHKRRISRMTEEMKAWGVIIENNKPDGQIPPESAFSPTFVQISKAEESEADNYGSKIAAVRMLLKTYGPKGVTPREVTEYLRFLNMQVSSSFASNALFTMRQRKEVVRVGNKYVLAHLTDPFVVAEPLDSHVKGEPEGSP